MKKLLPLLTVFFLFVGCDSPLEVPEDDMVRAIRYEVDGEAEQAIIEFIDGDGKVKGTGIADVPWTREFDMDVGEKLYLSAWSSESGGGSISIRVLVDGDIFREQSDNVGIRTRISGNAF